MASKACYSATRRHLLTGTYMCVACAIRRSCQLVVAELPRMKGGQV